MWNIGSSILRRIRLAILRGILSWLSRIGWRILTSLRIRLRILSRLRIRLRILTTLGIGLRILARLLLRILATLRRSRILCRGRRWRCRRTLTLTLRRSHRPIRLQLSLRRIGRIASAQRQLIDNFLYALCLRSQGLRQCS